jgi:type II secretory pathway component GspD/PulD (secretin)
MNFPNHRRTGTIRNLLGLCFLVTILSVMQTSRANPGAATLDDIRFNTVGEGSVQIAISGTDLQNTVTPTFIDNPSRLVVDFQDSILGFNDGRARKFPIEVGDLNAVGISQYQRHPDIVRVVLYFRTGDEASLLKALKVTTENGRIIMTYSVGDTSPKQPPQLTNDKSGLIEKLLHQRVGPERDRFTLKSSVQFDDPVVKYIQGGLILHFSNIRFQVPAGSGSDFQVPVTGALIDEIQVVNNGDGATLFLRLKDSARSFSVNHEVTRVDRYSLNFEVLRSYAPTAETDNTVSPQPVKSTEGKITGLVQVLGSSLSDSGVQSDSGFAKIIRIQYQPLSIGERFIIEAQGDFAPSFSKLNYPNRLNMKASNTGVILPKEAQDKFQVKIEGAMSKLMKVFLKEQEGVPESVIQFYYEIGENEDIQYNFYSTETDNIYYLDLIPIAIAYPIQSPSEARPVPVVKPEVVKPEVVKPIEIEKAPEVVAIPPVIEEKPVEVVNPPVVVVEPIETEPVVETSKEPESDSTITFNIPSEDKYESVVSIPKSVNESDETAVATTPAVVQPAIEQKVVQPEPKVETEPQEAIVETSVPSVVEEPTQPQAAQTPMLASVQIQYIADANTDKFVITSTDPIDEYSHNELNFPSRLAIEFPNRSIDFNSLKSGVTRYMGGKSAESVRIIERDYPVKRSILYIYLKDKWENADCKMSGSPDQITIEMSPLTIEPPVQVAMVKPAPVIIEPVIEKPAAEQAPVVEEKPIVAQPEQKPAVVEETKEESNFSLSFKIEEPKIEESKTEEPVIEETVKDEPLVQAEVVRIPAVTAEPEPVVETAVEETIEQPVEEKPVIEEKPEEKAVSEQPTESVVEEPTEENDDFIDIRYIKEEPKEDQMVAEVILHKTDAFPLKKGEVEIPSNCIGSFDMIGDSGSGGFTLSATGAYLPEPEMKWYNYPARLNFEFEGVGVDIGGEIGRYSKIVDSTLVNKVQIIQHQGDRIPLAASLILYLKPGFDSSNVNVRTALVDSKTFKIELADTGMKVADSTTTGTPTTDENEVHIEITDNDFTISDLENQEVDESTPVPVITEKSLPVDESATPADETESSTATPATEGRYQPVEKAPEKVLVEEPLVTIILQNANIEDVLMLIAENTGIDISMESKSVRGTITIKVTRKPISQVFDLIATQGNFKWNKYKDTYIFGSEDFIWDVPGVITPRVVRLKYADPTKVRAVLTALRLGGSRGVTLYQSANIGSSGQAGQIPTAQNALVLKGDQQQIDSMMEVIRQLDVPPLMIKVNMKVIEYSLTDDVNTGFNWSIGNGGSTAGTDKGFISFSLTENETKGQLPLQGFKRQNSFDINMIYNFLDAKGDAKILADSTLTVANGGKGEFFVGETIPYRSTFQVSDFGRVTQRIQQENVGISLRFQAQASDDGMITLYLDPDLSNLKEITDIGPRTSNKRFNTTIRIPSGQPYAIGGMINDSDRVTYDTVPFLGDLPLIGKLFTGKSKSHQRSEMIVIFTPEIIHDAASMKYESMYELQESDSTFSLN